MIHREPEVCCKQATHATHSSLSLQASHCNSGYDMGSHGQSYRSSSRGRIAGKSTLLDVLALRKGTGKLTGQVCLWVAEQKPHSDTILPALLKMEVDSHARTM